MDTNYNISFGAKFIRPSVVNKLSSDNQYLPHNISFVKINPKSKDDLRVLKDLCSSWAPQTFVDDICWDVFTILRQNPKDGFVYAATEQLNKFSKLEPKKVLGLVELTPDGDKQVFIEYLQVNPKYITDRKNSPIKGIGTSILNCLKSLYKDKKISLMSVESKAVEQFYINNGFKANPAVKQNFEWNV